MKNASFEDEYKKTSKLVFDEVWEAINSIDCSQTEKLISDICEAEKIFVTGVGRVLLSMQAFVKRLNHLGIEAHCVGDVTEPAITENDILIVASGSGESIVPVAIAKKAKEIGCKRIIHIGSNPNGSLSRYSDYLVRIPVQTRLHLPNEIKSAQIMTSLFEQSLLLYGDIVSMTILNGIDASYSVVEGRHANLE